MNALTIFHGRLLPLCLLAASLVLSGCNKKAETAQSPLPEAPEEIEDAETQLAIGYRYYLGDDVKQDFTKAADWFYQAAAQGNADAQFALGSLHQNGQGVPQNFIESASWYQKAAEQGHANGQYLLGLAHREGSGVEKSLVESYKWLSLAADQGDEDHITARDSLTNVMRPDLIAEAKRRAGQFTPTVVEN
ncbi:MAG: sel1 repeat family protein [Pedosphaera sp.]|nr:sel1 repeat family protein [Pedosphaera sp.]